MIPSLQKLLEIHLKDSVDILQRGFLSEDTVTKLDNWCFFEKVIPIIQKEVGNRLKDPSSESAAIHFKDVLSTFNYFCFLQERQIEPQFVSMILKTNYDLHS